MGFAVKTNPVLQVKTWQHPTKLWYELCPDGSAPGHILYLVRETCATLKHMSVWVLDFGAQYVENE